MSGALGRVVGTTLALWLPLLPLFLFARHAINSRTPSRRALLDGNFGPRVLFQGFSPSCSVKCACSSMTNSVAHSDWITVGHRTKELWRCVVLKLPTPHNPLPGRHMHCQNLGDSTGSG